MRDKATGVRARARGVGRDLITASGWIAALFIGLLDLPSKINSFNKEFPTTVESAGIWAPIDRRFDGAWVKVSTCQDDPYEVGELTDGTDQGPALGHQLDLNLRFNGAKVTGEIISDGLKQHFLYPEIEVIGQASGSTARLRIFDWINAKPVTLATADVTRIGTNCLKFATVGDDTNLFPIVALMARETAEEYRAIPRNSELMNKLMADLVPKSRKSILKR